MLGKSYFFAALCLVLFTGNAQDCTLDIGGKDSETIVRIFQLNEQQLITMEALRGDLEIERKSVEEQIEKLLAEHPQSKEEDLIVLADKYKVLQQKLVNISKAGDKKLLETFNSRQYERYLELCNEAIRRPIVVTPKNYEPAIDDN